MRIEDFEEEMISHVQPVRHSAGYYPAGHLTDQDDYYRQQAWRQFGDVFVEERKKVSTKEVIVVDEATRRVGRMQLTQENRHLGAVELS